MLGRLLSQAVISLIIAASLATAAAAQSRFALVIGNSAYRNATALTTVAGDAGIVSETMRAAGYDVTDARDVPLADIGYVMRDFLDKVAAAGPDAVAFVYYAGYAAQSQGENYLIPIDAQIGSDADVPMQSLRLNDLVNELMGLQAAARLIVLDAARDHGFGRGGPRPVPQGLALMDVPNGLLIASSAAPGAIGIDGDGPYSIYTTALVTLMRQPGLDMEQIFKATRLQVNQTTGGRQTPWMQSGLTVELRLFDAPAATPDQPAPPSAMAAIPPADRDITKEELRRLGPDQAFQIVIEEDSLEAYQWFVELYPDSPNAAQIWDIIDKRREALLWKRALAQNTRNGYWNYLKRYPNGPHAAEAEEALDALSVPRRPPPTYVPVPEPLPPDYYDEAVGLVEIYPDDVAPDVIVSVFEVIAPLLLPPPRRRDFGFGPIRRPPPPPPVRFGDTRRPPPITNRDGGRRPGGIRRPGDGRRPPAVRPAPGIAPGDVRRPGIPPRDGRTPGIPRRDGRPGIPPRDGRPGIPPRDGRTPGIPPRDGRMPAAPGVPPTTIRPATPGAVQPATRRPVTPGVAPTIPPVPQTGSRPTSPTTRPTGPAPVAPPTATRPMPPSTRPGTPPVTRPTAPATQHAPAASQRPGVPPRTTAPSRPASPPQRATQPQRPAQPPRTSAPQRPAAAPPKRPAQPPRVSAPQRPAAAPQRRAAPPPRAVAPRPAAPRPAPAQKKCPPGKRC